MASNENVCDVHCSVGFRSFRYVARSSEIFCINSSRVISPFSIKSFASASVCARLETRSSSIVTGLLSGSAIVLPHLITLSARYSTIAGIVRPICFAVLRLITNLKLRRLSRPAESAGLAPLRFCLRMWRRGGTYRVEVRVIDGVSHPAVSTNNTLFLDTSLRSSLLAVKSTIRVPCMHR